MSDTVFRFGEWHVSRATNTLVNGTLRRQMEPRAMDVLVALCRRANSVVSVEELLEECWGSTLHGDNPVHKTITQLRRLLGDSTAAPVYIETIRKRGYRTLADVSFDAPPAPSVPGWSGSPFRGLQAFDGQHAAVFFGRNQATLQLTQAVRRQAGAERALVLVLGPSGSGKTSLIRAGLFPALLQADAEELCLLSTGMLDMGELSDGDVFTGLGGALLDWQAAADGRELPLFPEESAYSLGRKLESDCAGLIAAVETALSGTPAQARVGLLLDRFEAVFTQPAITAAQRDRLVAVVDALARSPRVLVVLACRNDFYPRIADYPILLEGKANGAHFDLAPPSPADITQIVRLPALAAGLTFGVDPATGSRLDDVLCQNALTSPDALPLLQYTLGELYRLRSASDELGFEAYHHLGGVEGALGKRAEEVVTALPEAQRAALPRVLSLIVTISADGDSVTSRRAPWSALASDHERALVQALVEARLLTSELFNDEAGFGVAHEALLRRWERVSAWVAVHRDSLQVRARIAQLTARWAAEGRPADLLLPQGKQLDEAEQLRGAATFSLSAEELALIQASGVRVRRRERLRMGVTILILALGVLAVVLGATALRAKQVAQQRRTEAEGLMGFMLGDFADKLRPLGRLDLLDGVSAKALQYLAVSDGGDLTPASLSQRAKALQVIGEVRISRGDPKLASEALLAAHTILLKQLQASPNDTEVLKQIGANSFWLGQVHLDQNEPVAAQEFFDQYRDYSDRVSTLRPDDVDAWIEQSYAHNSLGTLALRRADSRTAAAEFGLSIALKNRALAKKPGDKTLLADLADSLSWAGRTNETIGHFSAAATQYEQELRAITELHEAAPSDLLWTYSMALALQHRAGLHLAEGASNKALEEYRQAEVLLNANMVAEPGHKDWQRNLLSVQLAILRTPAGQAAEASSLASLATLAEKIDVLTRLNPKKLEWAMLQAQALQTSAGVLSALDRKEQALESVNTAQLRLEQLYASNTSDVRVRIQLTNTLLTRADIESGRGLAAAARSSCQSALAMLTGTVAGSLDFHVLDPWVRAHVCLGRGAEVAAAAAQLNRTGYREEAYVKYLSTHH
jgi:DNA-binding winged helix-turn-helix (wHTH) protein/tetratricopeptide (TPR) repeat protein